MDCHGLLAPSHPVIDDDRVGQDILTMIFSLDITGDDRI